MTDILQGQVIVITGASSGLGEAAARLLSSRGAIIAMGARRRERIEALAEELASAGRGALAMQMDVTSADQVKALVDAAVERFGRIDVMINNAGIMPNSPIDRLLVEEWDQAIDVNIKGVLYGIAAALPHFQRQKSGHFVNVASVAGHRVRPGSAVYSATKAAVRMISEGLRQEVKAWNVRTTIISPGAVQSELIDGITDESTRQSTHQMYARNAIGSDSFARAVAFALSEPSDVDINEILYRPTAQEH
ncbi:MAG TPA: SDR family oxidoreductase [Caulobacteraceae bacterium]|jgi:NADP-dependent 3-hydroxy acid dehydrogenase YdfG|nr:SDR family oxidoreductase [Caulobacteraceae bacterium]